MRHYILALPLLITSCSSPQPALVSEGERVIATAAAPTQPPTLAGSAAADDLGAAVRSAVHSALPFLEREGTAWMEGRVPIQEGSACVSCHHVGYAIWSHVEAQRAGIATLAPAFQTLAETAIAFLDRPSVPRAMSAGQVMLAEPHQAASLRQRLLELQTPAGDWPATGQFPSQRRPIAESDAIATMYALLALHQTGGENADPAPATHDKALAWIDAQPPGESTEWLAWRLVLAHELKSDDLISTLGRDLVERQRQDGGWGWTRDAQSDAFSTGQALYALSLVATQPSSDGPTSAAAERAARYLIESQGDDGTWQTASTVVSADPSASKDVIYHFWGTAWGDHRPGAIPRSPPRRPKRRNRSRERLRLDVEQRLTRLPRDLSSRSARRSMKTTTLGIGVSLSFPTRQPWTSTTISSCMLAP